MPIDRELARMWQGVLGRLQFDVSPHSFATWLQPTTALGFEGETLLVRTPHGFHLNWLQHQFSTVLRRALIGEMGCDVDLRFVSDSERRGPPTETATRPETPRGVNAALTFASYMPSSGNELALRACRDLSGLTDAAPISPVVVFGAPGVGKSHLLHATANCAIERGAGVTFLTGEEFANSYQGALRGNSFDAFKEKVRGATLFILDDLQYLAGRARTLEQVQQTIDSITNCGGQVVIASETHPRSLNLPASLASRLYGGLIVGVGEIGAAERRAFVEHTARNLRASMPPWCADRIAAIPSGSPRILRGAVHAAVNLDRCGRLAEGELDAELARAVVAGLASSAVSSEQILETVARCFETTPAEICGRSRTGVIRDARAVAIAALAGAGKSHAQIGALVGGRDASTVRELAEKGRLLLTGHPELRSRLAS